MIIKSRKTKPLVIGDDLQSRIKATKRFIKANAKLDKESNDYYKVNRVGNSIDTSKPLKIITKRDKLFKDFPLAFGCSDYGDEYCLDIRGLCAVLDFLKIEYK